MHMFGVLDLEPSFAGCRFSIGIRNSNDKSMRLALTVGYRVFVCDNMAFQGDFSPVLAKHTKKFSLVDAVGWGSIVCRAISSRCGAMSSLGKQNSIRTNSEAHNLPGIRRRKSRSAETSCHGVCTTFFQSPVKDFARGIVESGERLHLGVQRTRPDSAVQGHRKARTVLGGHSATCSVRPSAVPVQGGCLATCRG